MLPDPHREAYSAFQHQLERVRGLVVCSHPDPLALQNQFLEAQQQFQTLILPLDPAEIDEAIAPRVQSVQTEINKMLRLMGLDVMFLRTARQSVTTQRRQAQLRDRLNTVLGYCTVLLNEEET